MYQNLGAVSISGVRITLLTITISQEINMQRLNIADRILKSCCLLIKDQSLRES